MHAHILSSSNQQKNKKNVPVLSPTREKHWYGEGDAFDMSVSSQLPSGVLKPPGLFA